jgi:hypothetical protein
MSRLKPANVFPEPNDYEGKTKAHRVVVMINVLKRKKFNKPFIISGHKKFRKGLYKFYRKRIVKIQDFRPRKVQPKRVKWLTLGRIRYFKSRDIQKQFGKSVKRIFKL